MNEGATLPSLLVRFLGAVIVPAPVTRAGAKRMKFPSLAGCILPGAGLSGLDSHYAAFARGGSGGILIGAGMIPRAEIALMVMQRDLRFGDRPVPSALYGSTVVARPGTGMLAFPVLHSLLRGRDKRIAG